MRLSTRMACSEKVSQLMHKDKELILVTADGADYPMIPHRRHIEVGIAEATQLNVALGLSLKGFKVIVTGITSFMLENSNLQLKNIGYHSANIIMIGVGSGISYGKLGYSHHSPNDIALISAVPGVKIYLPSDSNEAVEAIESAYRGSGPSFIRLRTGLEESISRGIEIDFHTPQLLVNNGKKNLIVTYGALVHRACEFIEKSKTKSSLLNLNSWNLYPVQKLLLLLSEYKNIFIFEEHYETIGLGAQIMASFNLHRVKSPRIVLKGLPEEYVDFNGTDEYLFDRFNISENSMSKLINQKS